MADLSDVEQAILDVVTSCMYPGGPDQPSVFGTIIRTYRGWPSAATLNSDLPAGKVNLTVFPDSDPGHDTTRSRRIWSQPAVAATAHMSVCGDTVVFDGTMEVGQALGLIVDGVAYAYRAKEGDSPELVASIFGEQIAGDRIVQYSGRAITIPHAHCIVGRIVCDQNVMQEVRRQERNIRVSCWCPTPQLRDQVATAVDQVLSQYKFLPLGDGSDARISYHGSQVYDNLQNALLYRRDLIYTLEYATVSTAAEPGMLFGDLNINSSDIIA